MARNGEKRQKHNGKSELEDEVDGLFQLPLSEFTSARNALASRLKQSGRANDANLVKTLTKPSVSAWSVNQLYWQHREAFDRLLAAGDRLRKLQSPGLAGRVADMRASLNARTAALSHLSDLATTLLRAADHNPAPDTIRRITTTLEAISTLASSDGPTPGRLTHDVDPPGFESLASLMAGAVVTERVERPARPVHPVPPTPSIKPAVVVKKVPPPRNDLTNERKLQEARRLDIAAAKASVVSAKKALADAQTRAQALEAAKKKTYAQIKEANAAAKRAEKEWRAAEERFNKASAASEEAVEQAQSIGDELAQAMKAVGEAKRSLEVASKELESLF